MFTEMQEKWQDKKKRPFMVLMMVIFVASKVLALVHLYAMQKELRGKHKKIWPLVIVLVPPGAFVYFAFYAVLSVSRRKRRNSVWDSSRGEASRRTVGGTSHLHMRST
ncbi:MAG: hypothetical protein GF331_09720 [Chitinivibrionales bacterium]|nr:hypothetical protein [Chitinivibrionales bacterium]